MNEGKNLEEMLIAAKIKSEKKEAEMAIFRSDVINVIDQHIDTLAIKYKQNVYMDSYGKPVTSKWLKECSYFVEQVIRPQIPLYIDEKWELAFDLVNEHVGNHCNNAVTEEMELPSDVENLSPVEFEHYCAITLQCKGWAARVTKATGDQGIDVIATYGNVKAVLQCKKYSQPVGNAAVQEIIAGKAFEQAHVAAVVSNASFTPSAKQLASATGIHLLHYSELPQFAERLGLVEESQPIQGL